MWAGSILNVWFWSRAGHVLSDLPSCLKFMRDCGEWEGQSSVRFGIVLDPVGMLTAEMLPKAEDFVARIIEGAAGQDRVGALAVCNVSVERSSASVGPPWRSPAHRGSIAPERLGDLMLAIGPNTAVALVDEDVEAQRAALGV